MRRTKSGIICRARCRKQIIDKKIKVYVDQCLRGRATERQLGNRINTIMQTCFFAISGVLPRDEAIEKIKVSIKKTYGKRGEPVVSQNFRGRRCRAGPSARGCDSRAASPATLISRRSFPSRAPAFVHKVTAEIIAGRGDRLPVSAFPVDGTYPVGTAQWEKRNIAQDVPVWEPDLCIRMRQVRVGVPALRRFARRSIDDCIWPGAPEASNTCRRNGASLPDQLYTIQVAVEDCTGCRLCVEVCPAKDKSNVSRKALNMHPQLPLRESERANWDYFLTLPEIPQAKRIALQHHQKRSTAAAAVRILGRLFRLR